MIRHSPVPPYADAVIVGAGPAGLAVGACLARLGRRAVLLERGDAPGWSWHGQYDALALHTTKRRSALPFLRFPAIAQRYPSRADVAAYLLGYAKHFALDVRCGEAVREVRRRDGMWETVTAAGAAYRAPHVVVATGYNREPVLPQWPGSDSFAGMLVHSSAYRSGAEYCGRRVLVVGLGNSGADIAADLARSGARVSVAVRGSVHLVPRDLAGANWHSLFELCPRLLMAVGKRLGPPGRAVAPLLAGAFWQGVQNLLYGDLRRHGLELESWRPIIERWLAVRPPVTAGELPRLVREGIVTVRPALVALSARGARFADGSEEPFDAIVAATGFRPAVSTLLPGIEMPALGAGEGLPARTDGLHVVGFPPLLRQISSAALEVARAIAAGAPRDYGTTRPAGS